MATIQLKTVSRIEEMVEAFPLVLELYPDFTMEVYQDLLTKMLPHQYKQLWAVKNEEIVGLSGYWIGHKLWCQKYLELDNVIVSPKVQSEGVGAQMVNFLEKLAIEEGCTMLALDSYTDNFRAHKFFYNCGFIPRGFHFIKRLK